MANPTTNYGWPMPTSSDLVTDLPADFDAFGQPVDTTLKALNPETTLGDISFRSATLNTNTRLGIGTNGQVLAVSGGVPAWTTTADVTPLTTKGDLFTFTTEDARLPVGTDGYTLVADSGAATGLAYSAGIPVVLNAQTATYTVVLGDAYKLVTMSNAAANDFQIPTNANVAFPIGSVINVIQIGAGTTTIEAVTPGTTTISSTGATATAPELRAQFSAASCIKVATDTWYVVGDIA
jgi:hypothetical protein